MRLPILFLALSAAGTAALLEHERDAAIARAAALERGAERFFEGKDEDEGEDADEGRDADETESEDGDEAEDEAEEAAEAYFQPRGASEDGSRRRRGFDVDISVEASRGAAAATTWIRPGDNSRPSGTPSTPTTTSST